jgi:acetylglutamate kinase
MERMGRMRRDFFLEPSQTPSIGDEMSDVMLDHTTKASVLIEALPYMQAFRGQTFVIKVGGSAMDDWSLIEELLRDVVFLEAIGINPVLVHGGGKAISKAMAEAGLAAHFINGLRVTDDATIAIVENTLNQAVNPLLVKSANDFGGRAIGLNGQRVFLGKKKDPVIDHSTGQSADLGWVGEVVDFRLDEIEALIRGEVIPIVSPIASEVGSHKPLNCNADVAAAALAGRLKAAKFIYLSDVRGVMGDPADPDSLYSSLDRAQVQMLIRDGIITGGMIPKVESALTALDHGVGKVHMIDGRLRHSLLLEIFTQAGIGTEIIA